MSTRSRVLVVMRHAHAVPAAASDQERVLTDAGHDEARQAGAWLGARGVVPDLALVSAAARTRQTWEDVAEAAGWEASLAQHDEGLYSAGPETVLDLLRDVEESVRTLVVVGHNPTVEILVHQLDDAEGDADAQSALLRGFPPGSTAVLGVETPWADLGDASARLLAFRSSR